MSVFACYRVDQCEFEIALCVKCVPIQVFLLNAFTLVMEHVKVTVPLVATVPQILSPALQSPSHLQIFLSVQFVENKTRLKTEVNIELIFVSWPEI